MEPAGRFPEVLGTCQMGRKLWACRPGPHAHLLWAAEAAAFAGAAHGPFHIAGVARMLCRGRGVHHDAAPDPRSKLLAILGQAPVGRVGPFQGRCNKLHGHHTHMACLQEGHEDVLPLGRCKCQVPPHELELRAQG